MALEPQPLVSVVIPSYNRAGLIVATIQSVLAQDYGNLEVICVDDASTDDTERVVGGIADARVSYFRMPVNSGAPAARNKGVELAKGTYTAFLDSDDLWSPTKLTRQVERIQAAGPRTAMVYTGITKMDETGKVLGIKLPRHRGNLLPHLLMDNAVGSTSTALVRTEALRKLGGFDTRFRARQDYDLWIRIAQEYEIDFVPEALVSYLVHSDRISSNWDSRLQGCSLFLEKHRKTIAASPRALAYHLYGLGLIHKERGDRISSIDCFKQSLAARPALKVLIRLLQAFSSTRTGVRTPQKAKE